MTEKNDTPYADDASRRKAHSRPLPGLLLRLSHAVLSLLDSEKANGNLFFGPRLRTVRYVELKLEKGSKSYRSEGKSAEVVEWQWKNKASFMQGIKALAEYETCRETITTNSHLTGGEADQLLSKFVRDLADEGPKSIEEEEIVNKISVLLSDVEGGLVEWGLLVLLDGIDLEGACYQIERDLILRKPVPEDFEHGREGGDWSGLQFGLNYGAIPSAILDVRLKRCDGQEVKAEVEIMSSLLRLFKLGSVRAIQYTLIPVSYKGRNRGTYFPIREGTPYRYELYDKDLETFIKFYNTMLPLVQEYYTSARREELTPVGIAAKRYEDAVLHDGPVESRITSGITCLESLFLKASERAELSHRLSQRVAGLMRFWNFRPLEVCKSITKAYDIRSTFIHGGLVSKDLLSGAQDLCREITEYARISVVAVMQLSKTIEKDKLLTKLDNSMLEPGSTDRLKEQVSSICVVRS